MNQLAIAMMILAMSASSAWGFHITIPDGQWGTITCNTYADNNRSKIDAYTFLNELQSVESTAGSYSPSFPQIPDATCSGSILMTHDGFVGSSVQLYRRRQLSIGSANASAIFYQEVRFSVDRPLIYEITGSLSIQDDAAPGWVRLEATLWTADDVLYFDLHNSGETPNEVFVIGEPGGDNLYQEVGNRTGIVQPGVEYVFEYELFTASKLTIPVTETGATLNGGVSITFSGVPHVPIPLAGPAGLVALTGALGVLGCHRINRKKGVS